MATDEEKARRFYGVDTHPDREYDAIAEITVAADGTETLTTVVVDRDDADDG